MLGTTRSERRLGMTLFPFGTLLRLFQSARRGSRRAAACLLVFALGVTLIVVGAIVTSTAAIVCGAALVAFGSAGSRPGATWL